MGQSQRKPRRRRQAGTAQTTSRSAGWLAAALIAVVALAGVGFAGWRMAGSHTQTAATQPAGQQGQFTTLPNTSQPQADPRQPSSSAQSDNVSFLGPETDADGLALAEAGQLGEPALIWFHADWCEVCQAIKPTVAQMERDWEGKVKLVRLNVDRPAARDATRRYRVRGTPTFVFISPSGKVIDNLAGWPGRARVEQTLNSLLAMN